MPLSRRSNLALELDILRKEDRRNHFGCVEDIPTPTPPQESRILLRREWALKSRPNLVLMGRGPVDLGPLGIGRAGKAEQSGEGSRNPPLVPGSNPQRRRSIALPFILKEGKGSQLGECSGGRDNPTPPTGRDYFVYLIGSVVVDF